MLQAYRLSMRWMLRAMIPSSSTHNLPDAQGGLEAFMPFPMLPPATGAAAGRVSCKCYEPNTAPCLLRPPADEASWSGQERSLREHAWGAMLHKGLNSGS